MVQLHRSDSSEDSTSASNLMEPQIQLPWYCFVVICGMGQGGWVGREHVYSQVRNNSWRPRITNLTVNICVVVLRASIMQ